MDIFFLGFGGLVGAPVDHLGGFGGLVGAPVDHLGGIREVQPPSNKWQTVNTKALVIAKKHCRTVS